MDFRKNLAFIYLTVKLMYFATSKIEKFSVPIITIKFCLKEIIHIIKQNPKVNLKQH